MNKENTPSKEGLNKKNILVLLISFGALALTVLNITVSYILVSSHPKYSCSNTSPVQTYQVKQAEIKQIREKAQREIDAQSKADEEISNSNALMGIYVNETHFIKPHIAAERHLSRENQYFDCEAKGGSAKYCINQIFNQYKSETIPDNIRANNDEIKEEIRETAEKYNSPDSIKKRQEWQLKYYEFLAKQ